MFLVQTYRKKDKVRGLSIKTHQIHENIKLLYLLLQTGLIRLYYRHYWQKCNNYFIKVENRKSSKLFKSHCRNILRKLWRKKVPYHSLTNHCKYVLLSRNKLIVLSHLLMKNHFLFKSKRLFSDSLLFPNTSKKLTLSWKRKINSLEESMLLWVYFS